MPGPSQRNRNQTAGTSLSRKRTAPNSSDSDDEDIQQTTLDTLRLIQQDIADSKKESLDSQKVLVDEITKRVKHLEQVGAQETVAAKSELNKALLETIQWKTEELKKKQDARDEELKKMRPELREMKYQEHTCSQSIQFQIQTQDKRRFPMKMRWDDLVHLLKQKIRKMARENEFEFNGCLSHSGSYSKCLEDRKTLYESGIQPGSVIHLR